MLWTSIVPACCCFWFAARFRLTATPLRRSHATRRARCRPVSVLQFSQAGLPPHCPPPHQDRAFHSAAGAHGLPCCWLLPLPLHHACACHIVQPLPKPFSPFTSSCGSVLLPSPTLPHTHGLPHVLLWFLPHLPTPPPPWFRHTPTPWWCHWPPAHAGPMPLLVWDYYPGSTLPSLGRSPSTHFAFCALVLHLTHCLLHIPIHAF